MTFDPFPSTTNGNLDEQISQLSQCKPLSEQEVFFLPLFLILIATLFFSFELLELCAIASIISLLQTS